MIRQYLARSRGGDRRRTHAEAEADEDVEVVRLAPADMARNFAVTCYPRDRKSELQRYLCRREFQLQRVLRPRAGVLEDSHPKGAPLQSARMCSVADTPGLEGMIHLAEACRRFMAPAPQRLCVVLDCTALVHRTLAHGVGGAETFEGGCHALSRFLVSLAPAGIVLTMDIPDAKGRPDGKIARFKRYFEDTPAPAAVAEARMWSDEDIQERALCRPKEVARMVLGTDYTLADFDALFKHARARASLIAYGIETTARLLPTGLATVVTEVWDGAAGKMATQVNGVQADWPTDPKTGVQARPMEGEFSATMALRHFAGVAPTDVLFVTIDTDGLAVCAALRHRGLPTPGVRYYALMVGNPSRRTGSEVYESRIFAVHRAFPSHARLVADLLLYTLTCDYTYAFGGATTPGIYKAREALTLEQLGAPPSFKPWLASPAVLLREFPRDVLDSFIKLACLAVDPEMAAFVGARRLADISWPEITARLRAAAPFVPKDELVPTDVDREVIQRNMLYALSCWLFYSYHAPGDPMLDPFAYGYRVSMLERNRRGWKDTERAAANAGFLMVPARMQETI